MSKAVSLISGGIDSPVATHLMLRKGLEIIFVHFDNRPFTDEKSIKKTKDLVKKLAKIHSKKFKFYFIPHGETQAKMIEKCNHKNLCVLCRRMMYRIAEKIARKEKALALITGENLGQVASQTLDNLAVEKQAVKLPLLQPLLGFDKEDIIKIAKEISTYTLSIQPGLCCTVTPKHPLTRGELADIKAEEKKLNIPMIVKEAVSKAEVLEIK